MHWLVEVSRVGDTVASERYCIDARRWQSALQEARRMRGDAGALPKLTIELTDDGYRAVDPKLKVRYLVSEAPPGMPLTDGARTLLSTAPPPAVVSTAPPSPSTAPVAAAPSLLPVASEPAQPPVSAALSPIPVAPPAPHDEPALAASVGPAPSLVTEVLVAVAPSPLVTEVLVAAAPPPVVADAPVAVPPIAAEVPIAAPPVVAAPVAASPALESAPPPAPLPSTQVIRQREERPTEAHPIAYRELALAVKPTASQAEVEALLRAKLEELRATLPEDTRRYVQLAVFDHVFVKRPVRPPLGTLQWKDWRGEPVVSFPGFGEGSDAPPPSSISTSRMPSWAPGMMTSVAPLGPSQIPPPTMTASAPARAPSVMPAAVAPTPMLGSVAPVTHPVEVPRPGSLVPTRVVSVGTGSSPSAAPSSPSVSVAPSSPAPAPPMAAPVPAPEDVPLALATVRAPTDLIAAEAERVAAAVAASVPPPEQLSSPAPARGAAPASQRRSDPAVARRSDPHLARRRAPGEDIIGDLFERMHELSFMPDIVSGADFVVRVLGDLIPCEATLVHVFDLGRREFVVVRARGPSVASALMFRTPDSDPLIIEVMRRASMISNGAAPKHSRAFTLLGVEARQVMVRGARQGGRYLGLIELGNPLGGAPFHEAEINALEYVCAQFADFVASRPIVLDEDIVRG